MSDMVFVGIDIGSTTIKVAVLSPELIILEQRYERHNLAIKQSLMSVLLHLHQTYGSAMVGVTGSVGLGYARRLNLPIFQEVMAAAAAVRHLHAEVGIMMDIGGEDSKVFSFNDQGTVDFRMNGNCAGGTGAFLDNLVELLQPGGQSLDLLARQGSRVYPVAGRCGVFAKSDVQNLLSRNVSKADITLSVLHTLCAQFCATLIKEREISKKVLFCGGPFHFIPLLKDIFITHLALEKEAIITSDSSLFFPAIGAALKSSHSRAPISFIQIINKLERLGDDKPKEKEKVLFADLDEYHNWQKSRFRPTAKIAIRDADDSALYVGIDSGSTSTKMILLDTGARIVDSFYLFNNGDHLGSVEKGLLYFKKNLAASGKSTIIRSAAVTGYGEDLVRGFYTIPHSIVEPMAHFKAAIALGIQPDCILDIGGQDMKAIFLKKGEITHIEINEACSSGCGSFIQNFANSYGYSLEDFSKMAALAKEPCYLGSRCTVFMNSLVKQALHTGHEIDSIAAGLAYSVARNALEKMLKLQIEDLGEVIIVQGGTFLNPAIHKAFENYLGRTLVCPDISGLMGAYGAALHAHEISVGEDLCVTKDIFPLDSRIEDIKKDTLQCRGCIHNCQITRSLFPNGGLFYTGNRCQKFYGLATGSDQQHLAALKNRLLSGIKSSSTGRARIKIGIPRVFLYYENFPFWHELFNLCGFEVIVSGESTELIKDKGAGTITSDHICFPAKLVHEHIKDLVSRGVDRIFFPLIKFEAVQNKWENSYNCPIVTGYPDLIQNAINPGKNYTIPLDKPSFTFRNKRLLLAKCRQYFGTLSVSAHQVNKAFRSAIKKQKMFEYVLQQKTHTILERTAKDGKTLFVLAGRPYHVDPLINQSLPDIIQSCGYEFVLAEYLPLDNDVPQDITLSSWAFTNRMYKAAEFVARRQQTEMIFMHSFSCGPDAVCIDAIKKILKKKGKKLTIIKLDDMCSTDSVRLRIRTLVELLKIKVQQPAISDIRPEMNKPVNTNRIEPTMLIPLLSPFHSPLLPALLRRFNINTILLPAPDKESEQLGLKYVNNDICYPAILVVGDILKALFSGSYALDEISIGISQTGGQCRLSTYKEIIEDALQAAGFQDVPVVSLAFSVKGSGNTRHTKKAVKFGTLQILRSMHNTLLLGDALMTMYFAMAVREKNKGESDTLLQHYFALAQNIKSDTDILSLLSKAVIDFNAIEEKCYSPIPKIGIVGEIYVKLCQWPNRNICKWLIDQGIQPLITNSSYFMPQMVVNKKINYKESLTCLNMIQRLALNYVQKELRKNIALADACLKDFRYYWPIHDLEDMLPEISDIIDPIQQAGEGWLIASEILDFSKAGVHNIVCLQPFGCLANQISAKGIEAGLKRKNPRLNIVYLDLDFNTCEANYFNRLQMLVDNSKV